MSFVRKTTHCRNNKNVPLCTLSGTMDGHPREESFVCFVDEAISWLQICKRTGSHGKPVACVMDIDYTLVFPLGTPAALHIQREMVRLAHAAIALGELHFISARPRIQLAREMTHAELKALHIDGWSTLQLCPPELQTTPEGVMAFKASARNAIKMPIALTVGDQWWDHVCKPMPKLLKMSPSDIHYIKLGMIPSGRQRLLLKLPSPSSRCHELRDVDKSAAAPSSGTTQSHTRAQQHG